LAPPEAGARPCYAGFRLGVYARAEPQRPLHPRLRRLPRVAVCGVVVPAAVGPRARLLGLAGLRAEDAAPGLLLPRCRSIHTFGMRFALDVVFLDRELRPLARRRTPPNRVVFERRASAVLELPAPGDAGRPGIIGIRS